MVLGVGAFPKTDSTRQIGASNSPGTKSVRPDASCASIAASGQRMRSSGERRPPVSVRTTNVVSAPGLDGHLAPSLAPAQYSFCAARFSPSPPAERGEGWGEEGGPVDSCPGISADERSTRLNSSHGDISYAFFC